MPSFLQMRDRLRRPLGLISLILASTTIAMAVAAQPAVSSPSHGRAVAGLAANRSLGRVGVCQRSTAKARTAAARKRLRRQVKHCLRQRAQSSSVPASSGPLYWGAWIGDQLTGDQAPWDMSAVSAFESKANKSLSLVQFAAPFADCSSSPCSFYGFPTVQMENIREHGSIPVFGWTTQSTPSSLSEPEFQLADVISGKYDSYIRSFATDAKNWGHPFFLRFNWEMNGGWFSWSEGVNGNQPGEYVAAWRHVHDIFAEVGATNATWVWCPNVDPGGKMQDLASLYPGDEYVDWTGLDGYNWGTNPARPDRWRTFDQLYSSTYHRIVDSIAPSKPMLISEVGSSEYGGSKAAWIKEMLSELPTSYPKIRGMIWFDNFEDGMDWPIETSSSATSAFANGIQNSAYVGNEFGALPDSTISPPS